MTVLTTFYEPVFFTPVTAGESIRFTFPNTGLASIEVYEITAGGTRNLVSIQDYVIEFAGAPGLRKISTGGRVTFTRAYRSDAYVISIERNTRITQLADFKQVGEFHMDTIEFVMDKITMILQEIAFRKCNKEGGPYVGIIDQLVDFYPYGPFNASTLDHVINKATSIAAEIKAAKNDCSNDLENT